jgi:hypothetical protein|tara:strand:- start:66 stop:680 length:615 start_codon:yes stop_codon:yes gene_type:complete
MKNKNAKIENFIGVYDNYITPKECKGLIKVFEDYSKFNKILNRRQCNIDWHIAKDEQFFYHSENVNLHWSSFKQTVFNFDIAFKHYLVNTGAEYMLSNKTPTEYFFTQLKIQKTKPTEGYHVWHQEQGSTYETLPRAFAWTVYLNDINEGGETEFLHFSKRVKPKTGRIVIWPAGFPYFHRGNPPLKGEKYILTSWMLLNNIMG